VLHIRPIANIPGHVAVELDHAISVWPSVHYLLDDVWPSGSSYDFDTAKNKWMG
jgi:hypothetical protein